MKQEAHLGPVARFPCVVLLYQTRTLAQQVDDPLTAASKKPCSLFAHLSFFSFCSNKLRLLQIILFCLFSSPAEFKSSVETDLTLHSTPTADELTLLLLLAAANFGETVFLKPIIFGNAFKKSLLKAVFKNIAIFKNVQFRSGQFQRKRKTPSHLFRPKTLFSYSIRVQQGSSEVSVRK